MSASVLTELNRRFAISDRVTFVAGPGGLPVAALENEHGRASVALLGAHVLGYQPQGAEPVIWLSRQARFEPGKAIRGGIPVIWPWFGAHPSDPAMPNHGFVRTLPWAVDATEVLDGGAHQVRFALSDDEASRRLWPHAFALTYTVTLGRTLTVELAVRNPNPEPVRFTEALHSYFHVGDISQVRVHGLEETDYLDKTRDFDRFRQQGPIRIQGETDRVYLNTEAECVIADPALDRRIHIAKRGSRTTVVWNPGPEVAQAMADFGDDEYPGMLCVETANAFENAISLEAGAVHGIAAEIWIDKMTG
jgi:D-hexose-6-phosphate mutarotase